MIQRSHIVLALSVLAGLILHTSSAAAEDRGLSGVVAAQAVVADSNGKPVWAEIKPDGTSTDICPDIGNFSLLSGEAYRAAVAAYGAVKQQVPEAQRRVLTASEYAAASFLNAAGQAVTKPTLSATTFSVVVRTQAAMRVPSDALILLQSPIDLRTPDPIGSDVLGLLMGPCSSCTCGAPTDSAKRIVYQAKLGKIAYKTAYFIDADTHIAQPNLFRFLRHIDQLLGPVQGVKVDLLTGTRTTPGVTSAAGIYTARFYEPPFPNCGPIDTPVTATVQFDAFNPRTNQPALFSTTLPAPYLTAVDCTAPAGPEINFAGFQQSVNFGLQVALLAGTAVFQNEARGSIGMQSPTNVIIGGSTSYDARRATFTPVTPPADMDLDGDGVADKTVLEDGGVKVWLGNHDPAHDPPDLVRLADRKEDLTDRGLLSQISAEDLKLTDIYVYRLSTMQRVGARRSANASLPAATWTTNPPPPDTGVSGGKLAFDMLLQGPRGFYAKGNGQYSDWAAKTMMDSALIEQPQGHLTVGEPVKIYLINRATGYMGSATATVAGNTLPNGQPSQLTFRPDQQVVMRPPNLRVKAERTFTPHAQETRENVLVGSEGAAMTDDDYVKVTTEWLDWDGSALPKDLPGFTGRLAQVIAANQLGASPGDLGEFDIPAGVKTQQITLPEQVSHFYIHVHPFWKQDNPDFSANAESQGRPGRYVPILVPIYNETETATATKLARIAGEADPEPIYSWVYRPEMQFSLFDLEMNKMVRTKEDGQTVTVVIDDGNPKPFGIDDSKVDFIYTLLEDQLPVLPQFGPDRQLVLAIGSAEVRATIGADGSVTFQDLDKIPALTAEDMTTLRLYENGDDPNVLWEYVLMTAAVVPGPSVDDPVYVSADEREQPVSAIVVDGTSDKPHSVRWRVVEGDGQILGSTTAQSASDRFDTTVKVAPIAGSRTRLGFDIDDGTGTGQMVQVARSALLETIAGRPDDVHIVDGSVSGETAIGEWGQVNFKVRVEDQWDNPVPDCPLQIDAPDVRIEKVGVEGEEQIFRTDTKGEIALRVVGLEQAVIEQIQVHAGSAQLSAPFEVQVHDVALSWHLSSSSVETGSSLNATVTATSPTLTQTLSGLNIQVTAYRAHTRDAQLTIGAGGQATTSLEPGDADGEGQIYARVGNKSVFQPFSVVYPQGMQIAHNILVGDQPADAPNQSFAVKVGNETATVPYFTSTSVSVPGNSGDVIRLDLGSNKFPLQEAVAVYPMQSLPGGTHVPELYQGFAGVATSVELAEGGPEGLPFSYRFRSTSEVKVDDDPDLQFTSAVGFSAWIRPVGSSGTLVDYVHYGMKLGMAAGGLVQLEAATTGSGPAPIVVSSLPITLNQWHYVEGSLRDGKLVLAVDGLTAEKPAAGELTRGGSSTSALLIGSGYDGFMASLRVHDWSRPALLEFADGPGASMSRTVGSSGTATFSIKSSGVTTAAAATMRRRIDRMFEHDPSGGLIKTAYAQDLEEVCGAPPAFDDPLDAALKLAEYFGQCNFLGAIKGAGIRIYKNGVFSIQGAIALSDLVAYTNMYSVVLGAKALSHAPECFTGFVLGDTATATAKICDFVSGMFLFGDIRDFVIQSYYAYSDKTRCTGHEQENEICYDPAVHTLAGLGIISGLAAYLGTAGGGAGAPLLPLKGALAALKTSLKSLRPLGKAIEFLSSLLRRRVLDAPIGLVEQAGRLKKFVPFIEIVAAIGFYHDEFATVGKVVIDAISEPPDLVSLIDYFEDYIAWHYDNIEVPAGNGLLDRGGVHVAHAAGSFLIRLPIKDLLTLLEKIAERGNRFTRTPFGRRLAQFIEEAQALKHLPDDAEEVIKFKKRIFEEKTLKAFDTAAVFGHLNGGGDALAKEMMHDLTKANFRKQVEDTGLGLEMLIEDSAAIDLQNLEQESASAVEGMRSIYSRVNGKAKAAEAELATIVAEDAADRTTIQTLTSCEGATHELHVARLHQRATGKLPEALQVERQLSEHSDLVREYDGFGNLDFIEPGLGKRFYDAKAWDPETFIKYLSLKASAKGQPLRDVAAMAARSKEGGIFNPAKWDVTWLLDARSAGKGFEKSAPLAIQSVLKKSEAARLFLIQHAGLSEQEVETLIKELPDLMEKSFRVAPGRVP